MELFHVSVTEEKRSGRKQTCIMGRRRAGRSDGDVWEARACLEGQVGPRAVLYSLRRVDVYM